MAVASEMLEEKKMKVISVVLASVLLFTSCGEQEEHSQIGGDGAADVFSDCSAMTMLTCESDGRCVLQEGSCVPACAERTNEQCEQDDTCFLERIGCEEPLCVGGICECHPIFDCASVPPEDCSARTMTQCEQDGKCILEEVGCEEPLCEGGICQPCDPIMTCIEATVCYNGYDEFPCDEGLACCNPCGIGDCDSICMEPCDEAEAWCYHGCDLRIP